MGHSENGREDQLNAYAFINHACGSPGVSGQAIVVLLMDYLVGTRKPGFEALPLVGLFLHQGLRFSTSLICCGK